ncbi:putative asparagine synthase (glutamine-hydrolyzing) [Helianthus anomalus]
MCGILAVLGCSDDSQTKRARVLELSRRLKHRGPDWSGLYQRDGCYIAHQRLAIVDPASGDQPLYNEDKTIVVAVTHPFYIFYITLADLEKKFRGNALIYFFCHTFIQCK